MNCILLLLLLSCCGGWGNGNGYECAVPLDNGARRVGVRRESCDGRDSGRGNMDRRDSDRRQDGCGCENISPAPESNDCGCVSDSRDNNGPGLIPPPWQEYPKVSHHDDGDDCNS